EPGDRRSSERYRNFHGERLEKNRRLVEALKEIADGVQATPAQVALRWIWEACPEGTALVGTKRKEQIRQSIQAVSLELSTEALAKLSSLSSAASSARTSAH